MSREVADLRLRLEEASLRGDAYLHAGFPAEAAEVVDEQRELLTRFEDRLRRSISEAAVEAEAERVLAGAPGAEALSDVPEREKGRPRMRPSPAAVSAVVAALLAVVALTGPRPDGAQLSSAESSRAVTAEGDVAAAPESAGTTSAARPGARRPAVPAPGASAPADAGVARGAPDVPAPSPTERLAGLIAGLADTAEDAVRDALRALLDERRAEPMLGSAVEEATGPQGSEEPPSGTSDGQPADGSGGPDEQPPEEPSEDGSVSGVGSSVDVGDDDGDPDDSEQD